jgi:hypothetical protein
MSGENRLRECEGRLLRMFGPKSGEAVGGWERLKNGKIHNLYASPNVVRVME